MAPAITIGCKFTVYLQIPSISERYFECASLIKKQFDFNPLPSYLVCLSTGYTQKRIDYYLLGTIYYLGLLSIENEPYIWVDTWLFG